MKIISIIPKFNKQGEIFSGFEILSFIRLIWSHDRLNLIITIKHLI